MKRYIREVVIPEYAGNFNKGLSAEDIKFYGKIHFDRDRSDQLNMQEREIKETTRIQSTLQNTIPGEREKKQAVTPDLGLSSVLGILTPEPENGSEEQPIKRPKKKKRPKRG